MFVPVEHGLDPALMLSTHRASRAVFPMSVPDHMYFHRARNAIYHLFRSLRLAPGETVLVPDYHNGNEVQAIRAAGVTVRFYRIGRNLEIDLEHLTTARADHGRPRRCSSSTTSAGRSPSRSSLALCEAHDMILVEDCALSLLSETLGRPLGSFGRYATFCLYKTLPVPNGGVLVANDGGLDGLDDLALEPCRVATRAGRTVDLDARMAAGPGLCPRRGRPSR